MPSRAASRCLALWSLGALLIGLASDRRAGSLAATHKLQAPNGTELSAPLPPHADSNSNSNPLSRQQQQQQHQQLDYELKFQIELDNLTVFRRELQQQTYKCQVRLAPLAHGAAASGSAPIASGNNVAIVSGAQETARRHTQNSARLKLTRSRSRSRIASKSGDNDSDNDSDNDNGTDTGTDRHKHRHRDRDTETDTDAHSVQPAAGASFAPFSFKRLQNVTLAVDWIKDDETLVDYGSAAARLRDTGEPASVLNVELSRSRGAGSDNSTDGLVAGSGAANKRTAPAARVDIKNTLNSNQLKLTSRLRLSRLRPADSGRYRCVARARYTVPIGAGGNQQAGDDAAESVEQTLDSGASSLLMVIADGGGGGGDTSGPLAGAYGPSARAPPTSGAAPHQQQPQQRQQQQPQQQQQQQQSPPAVVNRVAGNSKQHATGATKGSPDNSPTAQWENPPDNNDDSAEDNNSNANSHGDNNNISAAPSWRLSQFEDDEDLFRLDLPAPAATAPDNGRAELISSDQQSLQDQLRQLVWASADDGFPSSAAPSALGNGGGSDDRARTLLAFPMANIDAAADTSARSGEDDNLARTPITAQKPAAKSNESLSYNTNELHRPPLSPSAHNNNSHSASTDRQQHRSSTRYGPGDSSSDDNNAAAAAADNNSATGRASSGATLASDTAQGLGGYGLAAHGHLTHLMHAISPALGCYTNNGAQYMGNVSTSSDGRVCLNWALVRQLVLQTMAASGSNDSRAGANLDAAKNAGPPVASALWLTVKNANNYNHNHCRNPTHDSKGPYCYVIYSEPRDGPIGSFRVSPATRPQLTNGQQHKQQQQQQQAHSGAQRYVIARRCAVARCSEYLWLMVAAPPVVVLLLLTCMMVALVRSIRRSRYNAIFASHGAAYRKCQAGGNGVNLPAKLGRLTGNCAARVLSAKKAAFGFAGSVGNNNNNNNSHGGGRSKQSYGGYMDDDAFEIVDDIDWSDSSCGAAPNSTSQMTKSQSLSPRSCESFRLNHSATTCSSVSQSEQCESNNNNNNLWTNGNGLSTTSTQIDAAPESMQQRLRPLRQLGALSTTYKSMNPIFNERLFECKQTTTGASAGKAADQETKCPQSPRRPLAEPMFATLRCPVRAKSSAKFDGSNDDSALQPNVHNLRPQHQQPARLNKCLTNKSSSFIEETELSCQRQMKANENLDQLQSDTTNWSRLVGADERKRLTDCLVDQQQVADYQSIIDSAGNCPDRQQESIVSVEECASNNLISIRILPKLVSANISVAYDRQPIFEGKFSQVNSARYIKLDQKVSAVDIGAQAALFSLKHTADDQLNRLFGQDNLKVMNLNHLNLTKLIGYTTFADMAGQQQQPNPICSLIFDMGHLIDLSDWLKQQARDDFIEDQQVKLAQQAGTSLRQNLACFAKQIALALDYLHDRNIIYKDLACRNCFLDPTKMLVKLASFNIEPVINDFDMIGSNLDSKVKQVKSMIRPNHLPDYYVIDSRPSECQLLPLSWIPLESILFSKFNELTDIWSFGCLLYELYSFGEVAYFGYSSKSIIDAVRANIMPPQPMLCPNGIYKLMCKCLSDIPTLRPTVKQVYEQLILYSGQCSSFLDHHLCSLSTVMSHSATTKHN